MARPRPQVMLVLATLALAVPLTAAASTPTSADQRAAVRRAERSSALWATVNICNTRRHPDTIGVRGEIPALGFASSLSLAIGVDYYKSSAGAFRPIPKAKMTLRFGTATRSLIQGGALFRFKPPVVLRATVQFQWRSGGRLLGSVTRTTTARHKGVDQSDPRGYSAAICRIGG